MNTLKITVLTLSTFLSLASCAQTAPQTDPTRDPRGRREHLMNSTPEERANRQTQQMKKELSLTAEQEKEVAAINLKYARQMQPVIEQAQRNRQTMKQLREVADNKDAELRKILTESQLKAYEMQKSNRRDRLRDRRG